MSLSPAESQPRPHRARARGMAASALRLTVLGAVCVGLLAESASAADEPVAAAAPSVKQLRDAPRDAAEARLPRAAAKQARALARKTRRGQHRRPMTRAGWTFLSTFPGASGFSWLTRAYYKVIGDQVWFELDGYYCPTANLAQCTLTEVRFVVTTMSGRVIARYLWSQGRLIPA
jgi:hypothetical protein